MIDLSLGSNVEDGNTDFVGRQLLDSNIFSTTVKTAYITFSKSKAMAFNVVLDVNGEEITDVQYVTSGEAKGCKTTYSREVKGEMKHFPLPGYAQIDQLCLLALGEPLAEVAKNTSKKHINLYRDGKEQPTEVDVVDDLVGAEILAGILKQTVNKRKDGVVLDETRDENVVDKYFRVKDKATVAEITAQNDSEGTYHDNWLSKNEGVVKDATEKGGVKTAGSGAAASTEKPKSLFK